MRKIISLIFLGLAFTTNANAGWWDCKVWIEKQGIFGWKHAFTIKTEVKADRSSDAEWEAISKGAYVTERGVFGSKSYYACASGAKEGSNGESCERRFNFAECSSQ